MVGPGLRVGRYGSARLRVGRHCRTRAKSR